LHTYRSYQNNLILKFCKSFKIPFILQAHGSLPYNRKGVLKKIYDRFYGINLLKSAEKCFALNVTEKKQYRQMGVDEDKVVIIPNGIDLSEYENLPEKGIFRKKYGLNSREKIVLYLGRIHETKGIDLLVGAFAEIKKKIPNIKLFLIGPNYGYQDKLIKLIKSYEINNNVFLLGYLSEEEKKQALVDADVFATPKFTGFPVTFVEACVCGTPILTTDEGDNLDWIHGNVGNVVKYDEIKFAEAINNILEGKNTNEKIIDSNEILIKNKFNWDKITVQIENIYLTSCNK
jgi:glycosyltransferase involved in cell wall biosynthesis